VGQYPEEPTIATEVILETLAGEKWQSHRAVIADLTRRELWVAIDRRLGSPLDPGQPVRLVLRHPNRPTQTANTIVLWHIGRNGAVAVLKRPRLWDPPSRRDHSRVRLSVPVYLKVDEYADPVPVMSTNVSVGGVLCLGEVPLRIGQRVDASVQLTPAHVFDCQAEVIRVDEDPDDPLRRQRFIGLHFLDVARDDQASLAQLLSKVAGDVDDDFVPRAWRPRPREAEA
jgi:hypothetical protein